MNWRRGFKRITLVLAIVTAVICAGLSVVSVLLIHSSAQSNLQWKKDTYLQNYDTALDRLLAETEPNQTQQITESSTAKSSNLTEAEQQELSFLRTRREELVKEIITSDEMFAVPDYQVYKQEKQDAGAEIKKLEGGFLVNLSKSGLVGLCGVCGLAGGTIGFVVVWLIYAFLQWLVLGFCDNPKDKQKQ